jgi:hypothetical protein
MADKPPTLVSDGDQQHAVILPVKPDEFSAFIANLLGRPQTIERHIFGAFVVTREDVLNIFELVRQRIERQNESNLIGFSVRVLYDDNSSVLLNSLADFMAYAEVKPLVSTGLELSWRWLVRFRDAEAPEKQEIEISFRAQKTKQMMLIEGITTGSDEVGRNIFIRIAHTDRSWGSDVDLLIKGFCDNLLFKESDGSVLIQKYSGYIGIIVGLIICALGSYIFAELFSSYASHQYEKASKLWMAKGVVPMDAISNKLDYLSKRLSLLDTGWFRPLQSASHIFTLLSALAIGVWFSIILGRKRPSYVILTKQSKEMMEAGLTKYNKGMRTILWASAGSVVVAALGRLAGELFIRFIF